MTYQVFVDGQSYFQGNIAVAAALLIAIAAVVILAIALIVKKLKRNEKMKYEFITIIAHKFRTPLTYVKWICDSWVSEEQDSYKKKNLEDIRKSNQKLIDLTGTLIEIAESESNESPLYTLERVALPAMVREISNSFKDSFHEKNIFFSMNSETEDIYVKIDRPRFEFVMQTLLENAQTYTPTGKNVEVKVAKTFSKAVITVTDEGIGISRENLPNIFHKFYRTENAKRTDTEGLGIGLYLARSIIRHFRGKIDVYSAGEDRGTTFTLTLPRAR